MRKLRLGEGNEVAQGPPGSNAEQDSTPVCLNRLSSIHTPPLPISGGQWGGDQEKTGKKNCAGGGSRKPNDVDLVPGPITPWPPPSSFIPTSGVSKHLLTDSRPPLGLSLSFSSQRGGDS